MGKIYAQDFGLLPPLRQPNPKLPSPCRSSASAVATSASCGLHNSHWDRPAPLSGTPWVSGRFFLPVGTLVVLCWAAQPEVGCWIFLGGVSGSYGTCKGTLTLQSESLLWLLNGSQSLQKRLHWWWLEKVELGYTWLRDDLIILSLS